MVKIAVLGYGTVGSGVVEVIGRNCADRLEVKYILDLRDFPGDPYEDRVVHDFNIILNDAEISVVCEVMGGVGAAYQFTKQALEAGKSVCTSNKELVAGHGTELLALAAAHGCHYLFEASVGGGIPLIRTINTSLASERIQAVTGILNGTTNYILSRMEREQADYAMVLKQAQELGYAERNPDADVEGHDACRKIAILSALMTGRKVDPEKIYTEGITGITLADFQFASMRQRKIKLLAMCSVREDGKLSVLVAPFLLPGDHPLAGVNDVFNGVLITGNTLGDVMFHGRGAGKLPTASAVVADVLDCAGSQGRPVPGGWSDKEVEYAAEAETDRQFFVRARLSARREVEAAFPGGSAFGMGEIPSCEEEFGYFTAVMKEKDFEERYRKLGDAVLNRIRLA